jgi:hypothetical protein
LIEEGKPPEQKLSKAQIERLDALGFEWKVKSAFEEHIEELRAFKAKFGHCKVTISKSASNKPYVALGVWCAKVRRSRRLIEEGKPTDLKLSKAQIKRLDALGFQWIFENSFDKRIEELRAFKAKFGHCKVKISNSASNKPYVSLGQWCKAFRRSRRLIEEGKPVNLKLSKAQIERMDAVGFEWKLKSAFEEHLKELMAFKAKFGHCKVTISKSASNKPYVALGFWCAKVRNSRRLIEEGKPTDRRLSKAQIERLDTVGFQWKPRNACDERIEELRAFKAKFGHCKVTITNSASNKPYVSLGHWCKAVRRSRRLIEEGKQADRRLSKAQIEHMDSLGFQWNFKSAFD